MKVESKFLILATVASCIVALDQLTKLYIHANFGLGESVPVIRDLFHITYVRNTGAAFGFLNRAPVAFREPFFIIVPLLAMAVILVIFIRLKDEQQLMGASLSLVLAGAIGNLIDRLRFGFVIDFLDFHIWPVFNVADSCITVGALCMLIGLWREERR